MLQAYSALEDKSEKLGVSKEELQNKLDQYYVCNDTCPDDIKKVYNDLFADDWVVQSKHFKDKYVFIGMTDTSTGTKDLIKTPVHDLLPGVFLHANVMDNILQDDFIRKTTDVSVLLVLFVLCIATGLTLLGVKNPQMGIGLSLLYVLYFVIPFILFLYFQVYTDIVYTELAIITVFILGLCYQWILVDRDKREIRKVFSNYLAPQILNEVLSDTANLDLGGNKKEITVLFSDIRGFTTLSESRSPEEVVLFLNEFFDAMVEEIMRYEGTLDKFIGDAIMAFWGAPLENENHAELAAKAALAMIARLEALKKKWIEEGKDYPEINIGIGLNTGEALVGHVGATKIKSYTVIGDTVNLASRLEGLNKQYAMYEGKDIIISEYTFEQIKDKFDAYYLEEVKVKG
jgi:adenylate cyclase